MGGEDGPTNVNVIDFITIATTGNAQDFGDLTADQRLGTGFSNSTRGFIAAGEDAGSIIDLLTIATLGNAINFGNLSATKMESGGLASPTRGVIAGGNTYPSTSNVNVIEYINLATGGDVVDFGDLSFGWSFIGNGATSNAHGGL